MRNVLAMVVAVAIGSVVIAEAQTSSPTIEAAIAGAAAKGVPLVIEFHAAWCAPCRQFEQRVLPARPVQRALRDVMFVRYDLDSPEGERAARRFGVETVPTFLVLDGGGGVAARHGGVPGRDEREQIAWFAQMIADAPRDQHAVAELEAAVRDRPSDLAAGLALAERYRAMTRRRDAIERYRLVADATTPTPADRARAATAAAAHHELVAAEARIAAEIDAAVGFVRRFPDTPQATARLALIAVSDRVADATLDELLARHDAATTEVIAAVRVALLARRPDRARALLERRAPDDRTARLLAAEVRADAGDATDAAAVIHDVCRDPPLAIELHCNVLVTGLAFGVRSPGVAHLRRAATAMLDDLEHPGQQRIQLADVDDLAFANAAAQLLRTIGRRCASGEGADTVFVELALAEAGGRARLIDSYGADPVVEGCLRDETARRSLPAPLAALERRLIGAVYLPAPAGELRRPAIRARDPLGRGALAYGVMRTGAVVAVGAGVTGFADLGSIASLRALGGGELEAGLGTDVHRTYVARGLFGFGLRLPARRGAFSALVGVGTSARGGVGAVEIPAQLRLDFDVGRKRAHVWARGSYLIGASARARATGSTAINADEAARGVGLSVPIDRGRLFFAAIVEDQVVGTSAALLVGVPIGAWF